MHPDDWYIAGVISQSLVLLIGSVKKWWNHYVPGESLIISGHDGHNRGFYPPLAPGSHPPRDGSQVLGISRISHGAVHGQWIGWPILLPAVNPSQRYFGNFPQHRSPWYYGCQNVQKKSQGQSFWAHLMCCFHTFHGTPPKRLHPKQVKNDFQADFPPARHLPNSSHSWERRASTDIWYQSSTCFCKRRWHLPVSSAAKRSQYKTVFSKILECFAQMLSNIILYCYKML
jgi:hypothetical protein